MHLRLNFDLVEVTARARCVRCIPKVASVTRIKGLSVAMNACGRDTGWLTPWTALTRDVAALHRNVFGVPCPLGPTRGNQLPPASPLRPVAVTFAAG